MDMTQNPATCYLEMKEKQNTSSLIGVDWAAHVISCNASDEAEREQLGFLRSMALWVVHPDLLTADRLLLPAMDCTEDQKTDPKLSQLERLHEQGLKFLGI